MRIFQSWLRVFGVVVAAIAFAHLFFGQSSYIGRGTVNATMESDLRFYNVLFLAYGIAFVWASTRPMERAQTINVLGLLFFLGGLARLLGWAAAGAPTWFYVLMIPVELLIPIVHYGVIRRYGRRVERTANSAPVSG
ncbi:DUF4345 domain-containing protein [Actinomycetes bacterium M1A6_2h]